MRSGSGSARLSIVIPTLNEESGLPGLLGDLGGLAGFDVPVEIIVVDGGSVDATVEIARGAGARVLRTAACRGAQLRAGAAAATGSLLCFLHGDVRLHPPAIEALAELARAGQEGAFSFRLRIDAEGWQFRLMERGANLRSRWLRLPLGDQGLVVRRDDYLAAGGHPPEPLMEDFALVRSLRRVTPVRLLEAEVHVSARRWQRDGPWRRWARNQLLLARYLTGASPARLAGAYPPEAARDE
jgi:rSAM/selenodomain-associated transferase 2